MAWSTVRSANHFPIRSSPGRAHGRRIRDNLREATGAQHAPDISSGGRIEGSLWLLTGENVKIRGSSTISADPVVPGTPEETKGGFANQAQPRGNVISNLVVRIHGVRREPAGPTPSRSPAVPGLPATTDGRIVRCLPHDTASKSPRLKTSDETEPERH